MPEQSSNQKKTNPRNAAIVMLERPPGTSAYKIITISAHHRIISTHHEEQHRSQIRWSPPPLGAAYILFLFHVTHARGTTRHTQYHQRALCAAAAARDVSVCLSVCLSTSGY